MTLPEAVAGVTLAVLVLYVLLGGADFGGGVWDLFARGPRARRQRDVIAGAIGPIWEANHVWMIVAVVLLFSAFPTGFSVAMTALHIPITLMLVGIVLRGTSFVFRKVAPPPDGAESGWQTTFAVSSLLTPVMIGVVVGAVTVPGIGYENGVVTGGFVRPWLRPFPFLVGGFTLALFAWLAACYLVLETTDRELRDDFRRRALAAGWAVAAAGALVFAAGWAVAPAVVEHFLAGWGGASTLIGGVVGLAISQGAMLRRRWGLARAGTVATVVLVLVGWAQGQMPWIVRGAVTIHDAAAPDVTLKIVLWILGLGSLILVPAFVYLYATFKGRMLLPGGE
ncbi:cytochrome d ubiquinol oxidase subunit II [Gaopeijia maritima]|uniref:Cytochrome d ubiquinol oxidase subunit II n=1 Tax=Gaopeijia maritima TaxID=3119007 RepID=A0ABU9ECT7_9BACT